MFSNLRETFKNKSVRLLYFGDLSFFVGWWVCYINMSWLTYDLTHSSFSLGLLGFSINLPVALLVPFGDLVANRTDKRWILIIAQGLVLIPILGLTIITYFDSLSYAHLLITGALLGCVFAFSYPTTTSYAGELVENQEDLQRAVSAIQTNARSAQLLASAINSAVHLLFSIKAAFVTGAVLIANALFLFFRIKPTVKVSEVDTTPPLQALREGIHYVSKFLPFWLTIVFALIATNLSNVYLFQLPALIKDTLHLDVQALNIIYLAGGAGAITGAVVMNNRAYLQNLMRTATFMLIILSLCMLVFALSGIAWLSYLMAFGIGYSQVVANGSCAASLQMIADEDKRGRIMGFYGFAVAGAIPLSNLLIGLLAKFLTTPIALTLFSLIALAFATLYYLFLPRLKKMLVTVYAAKNIGRLEQPI